ncbi:MAG: 2-amino-4-hydroxy-6-hydroxymethyldihydropteridine diphosphokinase [Thalassospira sp.]|nr:2-amino-4-hydroxy-6-hydroxymethyldihydropteridine diphosphokinase [Thalassospira sp.]
MVRVYLSLGSNLGDSEFILREAVAALASLGAVQAVSKIHQTKPMYFNDQPDFFNLALALDTALTPLDLLHCCQDIELRFGRQRPFPNAPRTLDIDIISYGDVVQDAPRLILPHPRALERPFVLQPLYEIAPDWVCPRTGVRVADLVGVL